MRVQSPLNFLLQKDVVVYFRWIQIFQSLLYDLFEASNHENEFLKSRRVSSFLNI